MTPLLKKRYGIADEGKKKRSWSLLQEGARIMGDSPFSGSEKFDPRIG